MKSICNNILFIWQISLTLIVIVFSMTSIYLMPDKYALFLSLITTLLGVWFPSPIQIYKKKQESELLIKELENVIKNTSQSNSTSNSITNSISNSISNSKNQSINNLNAIESIV